MSHTILGHALGLALILGGGTTAAATGMILVVHTTIWSALLTHEFMHVTIFTDRRANQVFGALMTVISGACYISYARLRRQHLDHHRHRVGYDGFSITRWVMGQPSWQQRTILALEYLYVPVLSIVARWRALLLPFLRARHRPLRRRIAVVFTVRLAAYAAAVLVNPWSILWLLFAHILVLNIFRVYDCFHHTFDIIPLGTPAPRTDRAYEQANTYSSLLSRKRPWLNWIFLNYGYHNAHHQNPGLHWLALPALDQALYPQSRAHCILLPDLLRWYHRDRITRIRHGLGRPRLRDGRLEIDQFRGVIMNISFIVYDV